MAQARTALHATPTAARRSAVAAERVAAAKRPAPVAATLQQRLGNSGMQAVVARAAAAPGPAPPRVSSPQEPAELEAHATAQKVMRMAQPGAPDVASHPGTQGKVQRSAAAAPSGPPPSPGASGGRPLPPGVRGFMEPRFGADFSGVRIHTDEAAAQKSTQLGAHAFTIGNQVHFGRNKFQPDNASGKELIAHELTHTIQQGAAVQRSVDTTVAQRSPPRIQRWGLGDALDYAADKARFIPGFRLLTVVLGVNPINMAPVERNAANILRGLLELVPLTGPLMVQALDSYGLFARLGGWIDAKVRSLGLAGGAMKRALDKFLDSLSWRDVFDLGGVWERAKLIFTEPIDRMAALAASTAGEILGFVREAILLPLARLAEGTRGYDLLKAVLGEDPVTGAPVARTPDALIGGFMKFIGQEEIWENLKKANAVARAWAWFQAALQGLLGFVRQVPKLFMDTLRSLEIIDLIFPPKAFVKVAVAFGSFALQFVAWAGNAMWTLLEIIFEVVSPATLAYLRKTGAALKGILKDPGPFMRNLVKAAKLGFQNFADNFLTHLKVGLIEWLTGALPGVYIPKAFSLVEIGKFVFSVLGLTWQNIRPKLVKVVPGGETTVKAMETGFDIVVTLVTEGPGAALEKIKDQLTELKDTVIGGVIDFVVETVAKKAIPKLISMFIPGAGFISAIISIYDTIMVFVQKLAKIVEVVKSFVDSIVAIAEGAIDGAAKRVESTLAGFLSLAVSFLMGFVLGDVSQKVMGVITKVRATVDKAVDAMIAWIVKMAKSLFGKAKAAVGKLLEWWRTRKDFRAGGENHAVYFEGDEGSARLVVASDPLPVETFLAEKKIEFKGDSDKQAAIKEVEGLLKEANKLKPKGKGKEAKAEDVNLQKDIEKIMNQMAVPLAKLLSDTDWGTEDNPAPFAYMKRRAEAYPVFYLATGKYDSLGQDAMKKAYAAQKGDPAKDWVYRYHPMQPSTAPNSTEPIGLGPGSQIDVGARVFFQNKEKRGGGVGKFKDLVKKYGLVASEYGWDIDHVVELQIGGKDERDNMWPLPLGENRSSGSIIKNSEIDLPNKKTMPVKDALEVKKKAKKPKDGLWLLIKSTRQL